MKKIMLSSAMLFLLALSGYAAAWRDESLPWERRADELLRQMTVPEKISQLMADSPAIPRLGIPQYHWWNEALHGVARNGISTVFPQAIALAATWNPDLLHRIAVAISDEARAKNNLELQECPDGGSRYCKGLTIWAPNVNIFRDPRWGRGQETYGEDPYLTGCLGVAFVKGLQGDDPRYLKTVATPKHFAAHSGPEPTRHRFNATVTERDLFETYLPAFERCLREGGAGSIMSSYNAVNGTPVSVNSFLLTEILRSRWNFTGAVVADSGSVSDLYRKGGHLLAPDSATAAATAITAGLDLCSDATYQGLAKAVADGRINEEVLDRALRRVLLLRLKLGQFDKADGNPYRAIPPSVIDCREHDALALEAARQSIVLLQNDGALPLNYRAMKKIAILGPVADDMSALLGNYSGTPSRPVTLLRGLKSALEAHGITVVSDSAVPLTVGFQQRGVMIPASALFTGSDCRESGLKSETLDGNKGYRSDAVLSLFWNEEQPLENIPVKHAKIRWSGVLAAPQSGTYGISVEFIGKVLVRLNGKIVIEEKYPPKNDKQRLRFTNAALESGVPCLIEIEYEQTDPDGKIQLNWTPPSLPSQALELARDADHVILTLGITPNLENEQRAVTLKGFSGGDRTSVELPESQSRLLEEVARLGKPITLILTGGSALSYRKDQVNAALAVWYYGQRGGDALADILLGRSEPGGRLPVTYYETLDQLPPLEDYSMRNRTYKYYPGEVLFPFGHGLSYTSFAYSKLSLPDSFRLSSPPEALRLTLENTGRRNGDEVIQVYLKPSVIGTDDPKQILIGFLRVQLDAGEQRGVKVPLSFAAAARWNQVEQKYDWPTGRYVLQVGPSSARTSATLELTIFPDGMVRVTQ